WLNRNGYAVSPRIAGVLDDYIQRGWCFTAMRIDLKREHEEAGDAKEAGKKAEEDEAGKTTAKLRNGTIQPIHLTFRSTVPVYPLRTRCVWRRVLAESNDRYFFQAEQHGFAESVAAINEPAFGGEQEGKARIPLLDGSSVFGYVAQRRMVDSEMVRRIEEVGE